MCSYNDSYSTQYRSHSLPAYWHTLHFVAVNEEGCVHCITVHFEENGETMSHIVTMDSGNPFAPPLNDTRTETAPANINYFELLSHFLVPTMNTHTHTLLYPSCTTWTVLDTVFTKHSSAMEKFSIVSWGFSKTSFTTCTVFACSWSAGLKCASSWSMPTHSLTLFTLFLQECGLSHQH